MGRELDETTIMTAKSKFKWGSEDGLVTGLSASKKEVLKLSERQAAAEVKKIFNKAKIKSEDPLILEKVRSGLMKDLQEGFLPEQIVIRNKTTHIRGPNGIGPNGHYSFYDIKQDFHVFTFFKP